MEFSMASMLDIVLVVCGLLYAVYLYGTWTFSKFDKSKVPYLKPVPLLGNMWRTFLRKENLLYCFERVYTTFPDKRFVGFFQARIPMVVIRDPELIRQVGVKDFDHFVNHRTFVDDKLDPLFGNNLLGLKGQKWRDMRATLSPAFTGSKMRNMYMLVSDCATQMAQHLIKKTMEGGPQETDMKQLFTAYSNDVIATAAFGIKVDTLENPENEFYKMGKIVTNFSGYLMTLKFFGFAIMPGVMKFFGVRFLNDDCTKFFHELVHGTMAVRENEGIVRPDMIHLLMQARQGQLQHENASVNKEEKDAGFATVDESDVGKAQTTKTVWSDDELTAQALIFFLAGFETASTLLCFAAHELAVNPDVQDRLQQEIDEVGTELGVNEAPDYERINTMKYLDMVVAEALRKWPTAAGVMDRVCVKPYVLEDYEGNKHTVQEGESIFFPVFNIHHDEKYFPDPEKFDPERFSDENKKNIKPFTYLPFGVGPRNCIGSRFALMEIKAILFHILSHFNFDPSPKTEIPLKLTPKSFVMQPKNGFWLSIAPRNMNR